MTKVSVIVPVLNGEATLGRALESLCAQTMRDFEAIVVDDGSTDKTPEILKAYCEKDSRFRALTLPKNRGVSYARNRAIEAGNGTWVTPLDADDWYEPERLEKLLADAEALHADAVIENLKIFDHATGRIEETTRFGDKNEPTELSAALLFRKDSLFARTAIGYARPMIRRSFIKEHCLCYDERFFLGEDFVFLAETVLRGAKTFVLPFASYVHVRRLSPTTGSISPFSRSVDDHSQIARAGRILLARYNDMPKNAVRALKQRCFLFDQLVWAKRLQSQLRQGNFAAFFRILLVHPSVLPFALIISLLKWERKNTFRRSQSRIFS